MKPKGSGKRAAVPICARRRSARIPRRLDGAARQSVLLPRDRQPDVGPLFGRRAGRSGRRLAGHQSAEQSRIARRTGQGPDRTSLRSQTFDPHDHDLRGLRAELAADAVQRQGSPQLRPLFPPPDAGRSFVRRGRRAVWRLGRSIQGFPLGTRAIDLPDEAVDSSISSMSSAVLIAIRLANANGVMRQTWPRCCTC